MRRRQGSDLHAGKPAVGAAGHCHFAVAPVLRGDPLDHVRNRRGVPRGGTRRRSRLRWSRCPGSRRGRRRSRVAPNGVASQLAAPGHPYGTECR